MNSYIQETYHLAGFINASSTVLTIGWCH